MEIDIWSKRTSVFWCRRTRCEELSTNYSIWRSNGYSVNKNVNCMQIVIWLNWSAHLQSKLCMLANIKEFQGTPLSRVPYTAQSPEKNVVRKKSAVFAHPSTVCKQSVSTNVRSMKRSMYKSWPNTNTKT